jgi:hypothetical protein
MAKLGTMALTVDELCASYARGVTSANLAIA